jgi:hypothetical protein
LNFVDKNPLLKLSGLLFTLQRMSENKGINVKSSKTMQPRDLNNNNNLPNLGCLHRLRWFLKLTELNVEVRI